MDPQTLITDILPILRASVTWRYSISLAGAHAQAHWDGHSDLDLPAHRRTETRPGPQGPIEVMGAENLYLSDGLDPHSWGGSMDFTYHDIPVEIIVPSIQRMEEVVSNCAAGHFTVQPELWTILGYYDHVYLAEASFLQPLDDPWHIIAGLRAQVEPYPPAFRRAAIQYFWPRANFWMHNFHYLSAIQRGDYVYTTGILQQAFHNLVQALFPLNQRFFTGDKRLTQQLAALPFCPAPLLDRLDFLLADPVSPDALHEQREVFLNVLNKVSLRLTAEGLLD